MRRFPTFKFSNAATRLLGAYRDSEGFRLSICAARNLIKDSLHQVRRRPDKQLQFTDGAFCLPSHIIRPRSMKMVIFVGRHEKAEIASVAP